MNPSRSKSTLLFTVLAGAFPLGCSPCSQQPNAAADASRKESTMHQPPQPQRPPIPETLGASAEPIHLGKGIAQVSFPVRTPEGPARWRSPSVPKQFFVRIENMTSSKRAPGFNLYVNLPEGANPTEHPEYLVDNLATFGLVESSRPGSNHPPDGLSFNVEVTKHLLSLESANKWDGKTLRVTFVPGLWNGEIDVKLGRVSLFVE